MEKPYYVVAGNYGQFRAYLMKQNPRVNCRYVSEVDVVRGQRDIRGVFIGTWYERNDIFSILVCLHMANKDNEKSAEAIIKANDYQINMKRMKAYP
jgi:hypothetical protein